MGNFRVLAGLICVTCFHVARACTWNSGSGATFDLSPLTDSAGYHVLDKFAGHSAENYTYYFNVCGNVNPPGAGPQKNGDACQTTVGSDGVAASGPAPAFQVANWENRCYRLANADEGPVFGLIEDANPSYGVTLTYPDGEACSSGTKRSLKLVLVCDADVSTVSGSVAVEEVGYCSYEVFLRTAYGCPVECPIINNQLCNGHGICGYNTDSNRAACYCNVGWAGIGCDSEASSGSGVSAEAVVLVIVLVLLAAVLGAVGYTYVKLRRLKVDPDSYKGLSGKFNELGTLAG